MGLKTLLLFALLLVGCGSGPGKLRVDTPLKPFESQVEEDVDEDIDDEEEEEGSAELPTSPGAVTAPAPKSPK